MKKVLCGFLLGTAMIFGLSGCQQANARNFGGDIILSLEPDQKLEMITWKDNDLWYLTRPMREDEMSEVHTFQQSSEFGVLEGTVTVIETKGE